MNQATQPRISCSAIPEITPSLGPKYEIEPEVRAVANPDVEVGVSCEHSPSSETRRGSLYAIIFKIPTFTPASQLRRRLSLREVAGKHSKSKSPIFMISFFIFGFDMSIGRCIYYPSLDGVIVGDSRSQEGKIRQDFVCCQLYKCRSWWNS